MPVESKRDPAVEIAALAPGTVFHGNYEVIRCIKAGGMGAVYEVLQQSTRRHRALKVMLPSLVTDPEMRARFELEAKIAAGIESEHIVETIDAGIDEATGMPFIVMELLKGDELGKLLKERRRLPPDDVVTYLHQAALALDRTHAAGIIHRDLKPENLFLTHRDDGSPRVKILDFGVAKIVADGSVNANSTKTVGSPVYMGPEQLSDDQKIGPAVDRYSLAHIAFTLLVGRPYWYVERKAAEGIFPFMMLLVKGARVPASERAAAYGVSLPATFDPWFVKATSIDPAQRHETAVAMIAELAEVFGVAAPKAPSLPPPRTPLPSAVTSPAPSQPSSVSSADTQKSPELSSDERRDAPGQTPSNDRASPAAVRSDEPSIQPVTVARRPHAWVVPVVLLVLGIIGVVFAVVSWPELRASSVGGSSESAQSPTNDAPTAVPAAASPAASESTPSVAPPASSMMPAEAASAAPAFAASSMVTAQPVTSTLPTATAPAASITSRRAPSKPAPQKGNNVLDEY